MKNICSRKESHRKTFSGRTLVSKFATRPKRALLVCFSSSGIMSRPNISKRQIITLYREIESTIHTYHCSFQFIIRKYYF